MIAARPRDRQEGAWAPLVAETIVLVRDRRGSTTMPQAVSTSVTPVHGRAGSLHVLALWPRARAQLPDHRPMVFACNALAMANTTTATTPAPTTTTKKTTVPTFQNLVIGTDATGARIPVSHRNGMREPRTPCRTYSALPR